jgi:hypothetical protein
MVLLPFSSSFITLGQNQNSNMLVATSPLEIIKTTCITHQFHQFETFDQHP